MNKHSIKSIVEGSIAEELELMPGDELLLINGHQIEDVLDYRYLEQDEELELLIYRPSTNEEWDVSIEKEMGEPLGIEFEVGLMDDYKSCHNQCMFCFIDQLPPNMRETMYFKDDDARLSFLQGNYITMTNMKEKDFQRILAYKLSPINISIHTMDMSLRQQMLKNRFADRLIGYMDRLYESGITMNGQIVLCKGINDGEALAYSIEHMYRYIPYLQSVSVVPVGLSKYRQNLTKLEPWTKEDAEVVLQQIHQAQEKFYKEKGTHFIHAGDEFYFLAGKAVPDEKTYDGYLQYENGVGMTRLLLNEFQEAMEQTRHLRIRSKKHQKITFVSGTLFAPVLQKLYQKLQKEFDIETEIQVIGIRNEFFGEQITVSGLVTGEDIFNQCKDICLGTCLYIPENMLKADEDIFLDDVTLDELSQRLEVPIIPLVLHGETLLNAMTGKELHNE